MFGNLEEVLGVAAVATYLTWVLERKLWVTRERQGQLAREELGWLRRGWPGSQTEEGCVTMSGVWCNRKYMSVVQTLDYC